MKYKTSSSLESSLCQPLPKSMVTTKSMKNPFRADHPQLFCTLLSEPALGEWKTYSGPSGDTDEEPRCEEAVEMVSEALRYEPYQTSVTQEIMTNFDYMSQMLPALPCEIDSMKVDLPRSDKKCLVLDLDETLIHTLRPYINYCESPFELGKTETIAYEGTSGLERIMDFVVRPYARELLEQLSSQYQIIVSHSKQQPQIYTSSEKEYAEGIVRILDPEERHVAAVLSRKNCIRRDRVSLKDLRLLKGRSLCQTVIVDNTIASFSDQLENGIYVPSFYGNNSDSELKKIVRFLLDIKEVHDVRPWVRQFAGIVRLYELYKSNEEHEAGTIVQLIVMYDILVQS